MDFYKYRNHILILFSIITVVCIAFAFQVRFTYDFEQFFPQGDPELDFFYEFREQFEPDDNFLLVGLTNNSSVFQQDFLVALDSLTQAAEQMPGIQRVSSLSNFSYFLKAPFGVMTYPAIHLDQPKRYSKDSIRIMEDERLLGTLISEDAKNTIIVLKTKDTLTQDENDIVIDSLNYLLDKSSIQSYHLLGKANFQTVLIRTQIREFIISTIISAMLVTVVFFLFFRKFWGVAVALISVLLCLTIFVGTIGMSGVPLDIMSTLFPILMIIVGVSDVVHFSTKFVDERRSGKSSKEAMKITMREIGLATFLTSFTTAIGFATLLTSNIAPVQKFGVMAAIGVILAYLTVLFFTTALLSKFKAESIMAPYKKRDNWHHYMERAYLLGKRNPKSIVWLTVAFLIFTGYGISLISTDVHIGHTLPRNLKLTDDFYYFESSFSGFRPFEIAAIAQEGYQVDDYEVMKEIDKVEQFVKTIPEINGINSITALYKSMNRAYNGDRAEAFKFPETEQSFEKYKKQLQRVQIKEANILMSKNKKLGRISAKFKDIGSDSIASVMGSIDSFILSEVNREVVQFRQTGTGVIVDKNNEYLRTSLLYGLSIAFIAVSLIMALLFQNWRMVIISLLPNVIPLLLGGAMIGYMGFELTAPLSIIFAISFGIAVDDTIHFLSKFKMELGKGFDMETALRKTFIETGKPIIITTIILFFGFLILLISTNPPTFYAGFLISITLFSALISDLLLIPLMVRWWMKDDSPKVVSDSGVYAD